MNAVPAAFVAMNELPVSEVAPVPPRVIGSVPVVSERATPSEEVAINAGIAVPPVMLARMLFATAVVPKAVVMAVEPEPVVTPERVMV